MLDIREEARVRTAHLADHRRRRFALWTLVGGNALTMVGVGFVLPMLPLLISRRGGSPMFIGLFFAAGVAVRALAQYPAGWLADRLGPRPVIIGSLFVYALGFPLYALPMPVSALVVLRCVHAVSGGAYVPAAAAMVGSLAEEGRAAQAFGRMRSAEMFGMLAGPAIGGLVAGLSLEAVFVVAGLVCLLATALTLWLPSGRALLAPAGSAPEVPVKASHIAWLLMPAIALGAPIYWWTGTFDTVWALHLTSLGAAPSLLGLSVAVYALPIVLLGGRGGKVADRIGHWRAARLALLACGGTAMACNFIGALPVVIVVLLLEGTLSAAGNPALSAEVMRVAPARCVARTQGIYQAALLVAQMGGALAGGALYGWHASGAFLGTTTVCALGGVISMGIRSRRGTQASTSAPPVLPYLQ